METQRGLLKKLGIFGAIAVTLVVGGKRHIASRKDQRHKQDSDAVVDSQQKEFDNNTLRPGFPLNENEKRYERESKYVGAGTSYSSRKPGDRLSIMAYFGKD